MLSKRVLFEVGLSALVVISLAGSAFGIYSAVDTLNRVITIESANKDLLSKVKSIQEEQKKTNATGKETANTLDALITDYHKSIDLTITSTQRLSDSSLFMVSIDEVKQQMTGVKISGKLINISSITYTGATFQISLIGAENSINVPKSIPPGGSIKFSVYVPDVKPENAKYAKLDFVSANISFY